MVFCGIPGDGAWAEAPNSLEVFHGKESKRNVCADNKNGADDRTPDMEVEHPCISHLSDEWSAEPQKPSGHSQSGNHEDEKKVGHLLSAVVATLRWNFNWAKRDLKESTRIATEVAEPKDSISIPFKACAKNKSEAVRGDYDESEEIEGEYCANDQMCKHGRFCSGIRWVAEVDVHAGEQQREPCDGVDAVEHLVWCMEAKNSGVVAGTVCVRHVRPPSLQEENVECSACEGAHAWCDRPASC